MLILITILQKKVLNVSPIARSQESPEYSNMSGKQFAVTATDDVYNHLNEKEETQDENTYDHACAAAAKGHRDLDDYSYLVYVVWMMELLCRVEQEMIIIIH